MVDNPPNNERSVGRDRTCTGVCVPPGREMSGIVLCTAIQRRGILTERVRNRRAQALYGGILNGAWRPPKEYFYPLSSPNLSHCTHGTNVAVQSGESTYLMK